MLTKTGIWRLGAGAIIAALISVGGWLFAEVRDLPNEYVPKADFVAVQKQTKEQIDRLEDRVLEQQSRMEEKIDETNRFLRDYFSRDPD